MHKNSRDLCWELGLGFLLDIILNTCAKPLLQKVLPCSLPCHTWDPVWNGKSQLPCSQWLRLLGLTSSDVDLGLGTPFELALLHPATHPSPLFSVFYFLLRNSYCNLLRYAGVIWFVFHVLQLLLIRFIQQNSCCISKSTMKHLQNTDWKLDLPLFSYDY
jgi:hypothetical protein